MAELDQDQVIEILTEKTKQGRLNWIGAPPLDIFSCSLEGKYFISVNKIGNDFTMIMSDKEQNALFSIMAVQEVIFSEYAAEQRFNKLRTLHELARRKALNIDEKIAEVSDLLEKL